MTDLTGAEDLSGPYLAQQQQADATDALRALRERFRPVETPTAPKPDAPKSNGTPTPEPPKELPPGTEIKPLSTGGFGVYRNGALVSGARTYDDAVISATAPRTGESFGGRLVSGATSALKDVGQGVVETPRQVAGGAFDAIAEIATATDSLGDWLNRNVIDLSFDVPSTGSMTADSIIRPFLNPAKGVAENVPKVDEAKSVTGAMVRDVAQFITGMAVGGKVLKGVGVPLGGPVMSATAKGAFSDFAARSPDAGRLADLIENQPDLANPITAFLKSKPGDSEAEKRLKNALEGAGLGLMSEGVVHGVKLARAKIIAEKGDDGLAKFVEDPLAEAKLQYGEVKPGELGDAKAPLVSKKAPPTAKQKIANALKATETGVPDDVAARGLVKVGDQGGKEVYVNFARMQTPDDVKKVIGNMADAFAPDIAKAQRGVQSNELTKELADNLGMTVGDLLARRKGQPFNAEQAVAARRLWDASAQELKRLAEQAAKPDATRVDHFAFRRALAVHYAIQAEVVAARTETARALQSWAIPTGGSVEQARAIQQLIEQSGGPEASAEIARRLAAMSNAGVNDPAAINSFVRQSWAATTRDAIQEFWVNALLSGPKTHIVNTSSNTLVLMQQIYERRVAQAFSEAMGTNAVAPGEAVAMMHGLKEAMRDAFRFAWKSLKTGESGQWGGSKLEQRPNAISAHAFGLDDGAAGRTVDFIGKTVGLPGRFLQAEDEFFKTIAYRMELHAHAVRTAAAEGLTGEAAAERIKSVLLNPPEHIRLAAADGALYSTFTNQTGDFGKAILRLRQSAPMLGFVVPFIKTPLNITRYGFERSPIAPLVGQWRADIAAGGARRDLALARMATGTTIMLLAADYADSGLISGSGPDDPGEREALLRQGWQPYSVKAGDRWYSYNRTDPFGMLMGFAADMAQAVNRGEIEEEEVDEAGEIIAAGIAAISQTVINKTYMSGIAGFVEMMSDPERYAPGEINSFLASFVPTGVAATGQAIDPVPRERMAAWDYVQARIPGFSSGLIAKRDLWGQTLEGRSGLGTGYDSISPVQASKIKDSPIDAEMQRLNVDFRRIGKKADWDGVPVNFRDWPEVYDAYSRLAGNELKHPAWGMGAKEFLDAVVSGKHQMSEVYKLQSDGEDGGKSVFIRKWLTNYRELARRAIMDDPKFAEFANFIAERKEELRRQALPESAR